MICRLCESKLDSAPVVGTRDRHGNESRRVACSECGLVQVSPRPSREEIAKLYGGEYWRTHPPASLFVRSGDGTVTVVSPSDPQAYGAALDVQARGRVAEVSRLLEPGARIVEVGCSDGRTLAALLAAGYDAIGVEPDPSRCAEARERIGDAARVICADLGDELVTGTIREALAGPVDAVLSWHMVEHLHDPIGGLFAMRKLLRDGGLLWCEVPDLGAASAPYERHWQSVHLFDFAEPTIAAALTRAGLTDVSVTRAFSGLQASGRHDPSRPAQPYEPHGGPAGADVARSIGSAAPDTPDAQEGNGETLGRFAEGAPIADLAGVTLPPEHAAAMAMVERAIRLDFRAYVEAAHRLASAFSTATDTLGTVSERLTEEARERMETWHPDPYVHGFTLGEAAAMQRIGGSLAHQANAMKLVEVTDGEREESGR